MVDEPAGKPDSVSQMIIYLRPDVAAGLLQPTRTPRASSAQVASAAGQRPTFLVLLRVGFT